MKGAAREDLWRLVSSESASPRISDGSGIETPWPGTLWVHPATSSFAVEWLVVEQGSRRPRCCLLVPADCRPVLGIADIAIPADELGGPLSVRCHLGRWVPPSMLRHARASGQIAGHALDLIRNRYRQISSGSLGDLRLGRDGGPSPAYEDWIDELQRAWSSLHESAPQPAARSPGPWLAACAVLVIGLGAGWYGGATLHGSDGALHRGLKPRPTVPPGATAPRNFTQMVLSTAVTRGPLRVGEIFLPPEAEHVMIYVFLDRSPPLDEYRLRLYDAEHKLDIWRIEGLVPLDEGAGFSLSTLVDRQVFQQSSRFRVEVEGRRGSHWQAVLDRGVTVRSQSAPEG